MSVADPAQPAGSGVQRATTELVQSLAKQADTAFAIVRFDSKVAVNEGKTAGFTSE